jgi:hypothetical protein
VGHSATIPAAVPRLAVEPTVGATPNAVPHGVRNSCRHGVWRQMYISRNFLFDYLFFENQSKINIKKIRRLGRLGGIRLSYKEGKKNHHISIRKMT